MFSNEWFINILRGLSDDVLEVKAQRFVKRLWEHECNDEQEELQRCAELFGLILAEKHRRHQSTADFAIVRLSLAERNL